SPEARELVHGTTDSEHVFALFVDRWRESEARLPLERLADATRRTLAELDAVRLATGCEAPAFVNLAVSDGNVVVVSRATLGSQKPARSLYVRTGERPARDGDDPERMEPFAVVASEPLELTAAWRPLRTGELVLVDEERRVFLEPIEASAVRRRVA
ncbi:MAG: class II glutamine amidotransferase, partial [Planctomycetota bacterium]|nr:class II glutamine amidotransferase [Planctomycetota bacterium]